MEVYVKWIDIMKQRVNQAVINGKKWCHGPAHEPELMPVGNFRSYISHNKGFRYSSWCKECNRFYKRTRPKTNPLISIEKCHWIFVRAVKMCGGPMKAPEILGISRGNLYKILTKKNRHVKKSTVERALKCLK